jgi:OHCU decarboxylase
MCPALVLGGVAGGCPTQDGWQRSPKRMRLDELNRLDGDSAARELLRCCGSTHWARAMAAARPFQSAGAMVVAADAIWASLEPADWLEAFAAHPRIGETAGTMRTVPADAPMAAPSRGDSDLRRSLVEKNAEWSALEQSGVARAPDDVRDRLATRNRDYEARFGYIFIVCASGKSAGEMLEILERRLPNDRAVELPIAVEEQRRITRLRLEKLLDE